MRNYAEIASMFNVLTLDRGQNRDNFSGLASRIVGISH